ncbi:MAG: hemerythrin domain-containing protein [Thermoplasmataceae archaeon]|jgi:hemerythrin superfamily protein
MLSEIFIDQHHKIDRLLAEFIKSMNDNKPGTAELAELRKMLRMHIYVEENALFRKVEDTGDRQGINGLEVEHAGIFRLLDRIELYIARNDFVRAIDRAEGLVRVLQAHNEKEEQMVYLALDSIPENEQAEISDGLMSLEVPEGWECRILLKYGKRK